MKSLFVRFAALFVVLLALFAVPLMVAHAAPLAQSALPDLPSLIQTALAVFTALVGWPGFLSAILAFLMSKSWITAAAAGTISWVANAAVFIGIAVLVFTGATAVLSPLDSLFGYLARIIDLVLVVGGFGLSVRNVGHFTRGIMLHNARLHEAALTVSKK